MVHSWELNKCCWILYLLLPWLNGQQCNIQDYMEYMINTKSPWFCSSGSISVYHNSQFPWVNNKLNTLYFLTFYSLEGRFEDEELQQLLEDIKTKRSFQYWGRLLFIWIMNDFRQAADIDTDHVTLIFRLALEASLNLFGFLMSNTHVCWSL